MSAGFVYLLDNYAMPNIYKIGMSERAPHQRINELSSSTSVPVPYTLICYIEVEDCRAVELGLHRQFVDFRLTNSREFFVFHPKNMLHVVGAFKFNPDALVFAEGDIADIYYKNDSTTIIDPWRSDGDVHLPHGPIGLTEARGLA